MRHSSRQPKTWPRTTIFPRYRSMGKWASTRPRNVSSPSSFWHPPSLLADSAPIYRAKHPENVHTTVFRLAVSTSLWLLLNISLSDVKLLEEINLLFLTFNPNTWLMSHTSSICLFLPLSVGALSSLCCWGWGVRGLWRGQSGDLQHPATSPSAWWWSMGQAGRKSSVRHVLESGSGSASFLASNTWTRRTRRATSFGRRYHQWKGMNKDRWCSLQPPLTSISGIMLSGISFLQNSWVTRR